MTCWTRDTKNIYTVFLGTENLEQQETKDAVTWDLME
jgi:hypothetical protein